MASKVPYCEPCHRGDNQSEGFSWCSECEETLCKFCDKAHRIGKTTLSHFLVKLNELPEFPAETLDDVDKCKIHEKKPIEAFCTYHDSLCCRQCVVGDHRTCDKIQFLDNIVDIAKASAVVEEIPSVIENLKQTFGTIKENRNINRGKVEDQMRTVKDAVAKFKDLVLQKVDLLEKHLIDQVEQIQLSSKLSLDNETEEVSRLATHLQDLEQEFQFLLKFGSNRKFFCFMHHLRQKIENKEKYVQGKLLNMHDIDIKFTSDVNFAKTISRMAKIERVNSLTNIIYDPGASLKAQSSPSLIELSFSAEDCIDLADQNVASISGIEITNNGDVLLCSFYGEKVLKYTDTVFQQEFDTDGRPYDIALNKDETVAAVTIPVGDEGKILFLDVQHLSEVKIIEMDHEYYGISVINRDTCNYLIGSKMFVDEITQDGAHVRRFDFPGRGINSIRYIYPRPDNFLFTNCSDLFCFNTKAKSIEFEFQELEEPRGIAVDKNGCIYIADKGKRCVWRLTANGQFIDKLFVEDLPCNPASLKFSNDFTKLYVGFEKETKVFVFTVK